MKTKDIASQYGIEIWKFEEFVKNSGIKYKGGTFGGMTIDEGEDIDALVANFKKCFVNTQAKEIASQYGIDREKFEEFVKNSGIKYTGGNFEAMTIDQGEDIDALVANFKKCESDLIIETTNKNEALAKMLITSGFTFDGYTITKYSGYISGDDVVQVDRGTVGFWTGGGGVNVGETLMDSLVKIRRNALTELKEAAYALGCNAVIGVDFDYLTLDPETANTSGGTTYMPYVFGVTANGNAVIIEKK